MYQAARQLFPILFRLLLIGSGAGCGRPDDPPIHCNADLVRGVPQSLVTQQILLPAFTKFSAYREDYDGNGQEENQFRNLISIAELLEIDVRQTLKNANQAGQELLLMELTTPDLAQSECARLLIRHAQPPAPGAPSPKFDGTDTFQAADNDAVAFYGQIENFVFQSIRPRDQEPGMDWRLSLSWPIVSGETVSMPLRGVGIKANLMTDEHNRLLGLTQGGIYGVQTAQAVANPLVPAVARVLTTAINTAPSGDFWKDRIALLETPHGKASMQKCQVNADCCAVSPSTCKILPDELTQSPIGGVLVPDVEAFDAEATWRPVPHGRSLNGFSVGLGFEAVRAPSSSSFLRQ